jgi:hypothetical protein
MYQGFVEIIRDIFGVICDIFGVICDIFGVLSVTFSGLSITFFGVICDKNIFYLNIVTDKILLHNGTIK